MKIKDFFYFNKFFKYTWTKIQFRNFTRFFIFKLQKKIFLF